MTNIVIPVKRPSSAKRRLGDLLTDAERHALAMAMLDHVLSVVLAARPPHGVLVITDSDEIETYTRRDGVDILREPEARGETGAVEQATRWSCERGFARQMVIPADLPCITRDDIETLLSIPMQTPAVAICPASGDDGTNAVIASPPDILKYRFGRRSFSDYLSQTARRRIPCEVIRLPRFVLDLDTLEDLKTFLDRPSDSPVYRLLRGWNLRERVAGNQ